MHRMREASTLFEHKIKNFAKTAPIGGAGFKIIFLDEADALTSDAQSALRQDYGTL